VSARRTLGELATLVRSKNAGPFRFTLDVVFSDERIYREVKNSDTLTPAVIADLYKITLDDVITVRSFDAARAIKVTIRRAIPSGSPGDTDVYGAQQHAPLLSLEINDHGSFRPTSVLKNSDKQP
jgi:hypothetical protein